ncbi:MAG: RecQ family ATP-dependent DNA helicase [Armatimonadota bacterium]
MARFLLRWGGGAPSLEILPAADAGPRDGYDRCRALLAAGRLEEARNLARDLVNLPGAESWGNRAVGEVFLAMERPHRADERFRAAGDPVGRARVSLALGDPRKALAFLESAAPGDPEAEQVRLEAFRVLGTETGGAAYTLETLLDEDRRELLEALGLAAADGAAALPSGPPPTDPEGLRAALQQVFGYDEFRNGQLEVIQPLMRGEAVLGLMPTGAGKSLCFQLPAALLPGATVVISPLIALMKDQVEGLPPALYRRATLINSSLEPGEAERRMEAVARGEVSLVYAAPERLRQRAFVRMLQERGVSLFVIDEAHCVSLWGHDFRPDYFFISRVLDDLGRPNVLALTATATPPMQEDIGRQLGVQFRTVNLGTMRPNLSFSVQRLPGTGDKWQALQELLAAESGPAIIYVDRRKMAEELADRLRQEGVPTEAYHAGLPPDLRAATQTRFMLGQTRVIAATVAFGMGVDKADVRLVVHYNLSSCLEAYYQEAGRAGRDGLPARCVLLYTSHDRSNLTRRGKMDLINPGELLSLHRNITRRSRFGAGPISAEELARECEQEPTRLRVGISLLERLGALERGYDLPAAAWIARQSGGDDAFRGVMEAVGLQRPGAAAVVPLERLASALGADSWSAEETLLSWQASGWVRYRPNARGMGLRCAPGSRDLAADLRKELEEMGQRDEARRRLLNEYLTTHECRQQFVARYFGGAAEESCGACDNCRSGRKSEAGVRARDSSRAPALHPTTDQESALFELLRAWRREKAREEGVPAYVIFHDRVLYAIATEQPRSLSALSDIPGVGRSKLHAYGEEVVALVKSVM